VDIKVLLDAGGKAIDSGGMALYEDWTNNRYDFRRDGNSYLLTYNIPEKARSHIPLILYGSAFVDGKLQRVVKDLGFDLSHDLVVRITSPRKGDDLSQIKEVRILVAYPDGSIVSEPVLSGL